MVVEEDGRQQGAADLLTRSPHEIMITGIHGNQHSAVVRKERAEKSASHCQQATHTCIHCNHYAQDQKRLPMG